MFNFSEKVDLFINISLPTYPFTLICYHITFLIYVDLISKASWTNHSGPSVLEGCHATRC